MSEIFEIITALNRLKDKIVELSKRIEYICKYPAVFNNDKLIDEQTACKLLNISKATLQRLRYKKQISYVQVGRSVFFTSSDINNYLKAHSKNLPKTTTRPNDGTTTRGS